MRKPRNDSPFCCNGHAFTADNTYINRRGYRVCRSCQVKSRRASQHNRYFALPVEVRRIKNKKNNLRSNYGLSLEEYYLLLAAQNGRCGICESEVSGKNAHVDHNHHTGKIRGILCSGCNTGLGLFKEDLKRLTAAVEYLIRHRHSNLSPNVISSN